MQSDSHPFIFGYLIGCFFVAILILFKTILFWLLDWLTKANVLKKNIEKISPPDGKTFLAKFGMFVGIALFEVLLSWINVAVISWQIAIGILRVSRDALQPAPEAVKSLRFPLRNNPNMSRESVWAYLQALGVKAGGNPTIEELANSLNEIAEIYPTFNRTIALKKLESLYVMNPESISAALLAIGRYGAPSGQPEMD
ncbi:MAG: hypothetical protein V4634_23310 [Pseudomonadota bacterium]